MKNIEIAGKLLGFLIAVVFLVFFPESQTYQWIWFGLILITIGIPHGAIDHLLDNPKINKSSLLKFTSKYLFIILLYIIIWFVLPKLAFFAFLIMSAYHFGQSHFINKPINMFKTITYLSLGSFYLSVILWGDFDKTVSIIAGIIDISNLEDAGVLIISFLSLFSSLMIIITDPPAKWRIILEMVFLGFILYSVPLLLGFIIYFGFWHALPSMSIEYKSLEGYLRPNKIKSFIKKLLPFSLLSLIGILIIIGIFYTKMDQNDLVLLFFILISLISAPHIWFMDKFLEEKRS